MVANPKNSRFWSILAIFGPLGPPGVPYGPNTPRFGSLTFSPLKYLQNETNPNFLSQTV